MSFPSRSKRVLATVLTCASVFAPGVVLAQQSIQSAAVVLTLRPGDLIRVEIWREADLSGDFPINELGIVTLPLLGEKDVNGIPVGDLRDQLIGEYRVQLRNPSITVTPLRQVHVLGEVNQPGKYVIDPTVSLAGTIALAGGASGQGDLRKIRIARDGKFLGDAVRAEATLHQIDVRSGDQIFVGRRSWFERNTTFVISALMSVTSLVISLTR